MFPLDTVVFPQANHWCCGGVFTFGSVLRGRGVRGLWLLSFFCLDVLNCSIFASTERGRFGLPSAAPRYRVNISCSCCVCFVIFFVDGC